MLVAGDCGVACIVGIAVSLVVLLLISGIIAISSSTLTDRKTKRGQFTPQNPTENLTDNPSYITNEGNQQGFQHTLLNSENNYQDNIIHTNVSEYHTIDDPVYDYPLTEPEVDPHTSDNVAYGTSC